MNMKSIANARELGGCRGLDGRRVKSGLLLRTAALSGISEEDRAALRELKLSLVIDFRDEPEVRANPEPKLEGARGEWIRVIDMDADEMMKGIMGDAPVPPPPGDPSNMAELFASPQGRKSFLAFLGAFDAGALYWNILSKETGRAGYRRFFRLLLEQPEDEAVLWHCASGKDRTGIAAALLLSVLGADRETILDDYVRTNEYMAENIAAVSKAVAMLTDDPKLLRRCVNLAGVQRENMEYVLGELDRQYGSPEGYVRDVLGLTDEDIAALREKYLEPNP